MTMPLSLVATNRITTIATTLRSLRCNGIYHRQRSRSRIISSTSPLNERSLSTTIRRNACGGQLSSLSFDLLVDRDGLRSSCTALDLRKRRRPIISVGMTSAAASLVARGSRHPGVVALFPHQHYHQQRNKQPTRRAMSTWIALPEVLQDVTIWGGSGWLLQTLHTSCGLEYWSCFAAMSVLIRLALSPFVLYGAQTAARFAKVVPEVQFLVTLFSNDLKRLRENKRPALEKAILMKTNMQTLSAIYKLHQIHPFSIFISPLLQMVFLSYISIDLRKIINGRDPILAQELVDAGTTTATAAASDVISTTWWSLPSSPFPWLLPGDLTEPDPWFGLPILAGIIMYANIEVAVGRKSLAGPATAKADTGVLLKDIFQSLAIFMPCFTSQLPSGIQIYVVTSFVYTMAQSVVLRNEAFRARVGLPAMAKSSTTSSGTSADDLQDDASSQGTAAVGGGVTGKYALQFIQLKQLEQKAREVRGRDGPLLGKYVLAHGWEISFPGEYRESSININANSSTENDDEVSSSQLPLEPIAVHVFHAMARSRSQTLRQMLEQQQLGGAFVHGVTAPLWQLEEQQKQWLAQQPQQQVDDASASDVKDNVAAKEVDNDANDREVIPDVSDEIMEKANRGQLPVATIQLPQSKGAVKGPIDLNAKKLQSKKKKGSGKKRR